MNKIKLITAIGISSCLILSTNTFADSGNNWHFVNAPHKHRSVIQDYQKAQKIKRIKHAEKVKKMQKVKKIRKIQEDKKIMEMHQFKTHGIM